MGRAVVVWLAAVNLAAFFAYGVDKACARHGRRRTPERVLLGLALVGGCYGAAAGMVCFHHKTRKTRFRICVPLAVILWTALLALGYTGCLAGLIG